MPDLDDSTVTLEGFRGRDTVVLFWNPGCGFCRRMLPDLKQWEHVKPDDAPALLVVSTGGFAANKEMDLRSTVVIDERFSTGRAFGASGTPSAVLVDAEGRLASSLTVGAEAVMRLLSMPQHVPHPAQSAGR